jgi:hypothetical protein
MATNTNTEFCDNLRLYFQYWENADNDKIVGYCRKNLLKPVKLRKMDVIQCIEGKLKLASQMEINQTNSITIEL